MKLLKRLYRFFKHIAKNRRLLASLAFENFREQYLGSYLGMVWAVLRPTIFLLTVWFIFSVGLKGNHNNEEIPFIVFLMSGYIAWIFFTDGVTGGMNSIVTNKFLVKSMEFKVSVLPIVKILSALFLHFIFILLLIFVLAFNGIMPSIYWLQIPFYIIFTLIMILGISWITASLRVFSKDVAEVISIILQFGFWVTPIFWSIAVVPDKFLFILKLNPMVYVVEGYRNTFIYHKWFWSDMGHTLYFVSTALVLFGLGAVVFNRLRPHFGDVL